MDKYHLSVVQSHRRLLVTTSKALVTTSKHSFLIASCYYCKAPVTTGKALVSI